MIWRGWLVSISILRRNGLMKTPRLKTFSSLSSNGLRNPTTAPVTEKRLNCSDVSAELPVHNKSTIHVDGLSRHVSRTV